MTNPAAIETVGSCGARRVVGVARILSLIAALALGLALSACDKCGDFWQKQPGACKGGPPAG
jgi:hypothetical protein